MEQKCVLRRPREVFNANQDVRAVVEVAANRSMEIFVATLGDAAREFEIPCDLLTACPRRVHCDRRSYSSRDIAALDSVHEVSAAELWELRPAGFTTDDLMALCPEMMTAL